MPFRLLWRNLWAHPIRTLLTGTSVFLAVFLLCVLDAANRGLDAAIATASSTRLWVQSAVSLYVDLPPSYQAKIAAIPGIERVIRFQWFGGVYQDPSNFFAQFAVDAPQWAASYPEIEFEQGSLTDWQAARMNCIVGKDLADRFGWRVGDRVPLIGTIFPRTDGSTWDFTIAGIYRSKSVNVDQLTLFFHFDALFEALDQGKSGGPSGVGVYLTQLQDGGNADAAIAGIEQLFENGPQRVRATTEAEFQRQFITMLGNVPALLASIGGCVLFAIFFAVLNTMLMAARERTRDVGILKALGFTDGRITAMFLCEAMLLCTVGGSLGAVLAKGVESGLWTFFSAFIPGFRVQTGVLVQGILLAAGLGVTAGLLPALRTRRLAPVTALRKDV